MHNILGLVMYKEYYKQRSCTKFPTPTKPAYDKTIPNNVTNLDRSKAEAVHTAKIADYELLAAAEHETRDFILTVVDDTWVHELREPFTFYTDVAPSELLNHLKNMRQHPCP